LKTKTKTGDIQMGDTKRARAAKRLKQEKRKQYRPIQRTRRRSRPHRQRSLVLKAIPGTRGLWTVLAEKLGCSVGAIQTSMRQEGWEFVREAFEEEQLRAMDTNIMNVYRLANSSPDPGVRLRASTFILEKMDKRFQKSKKVEISGNVNHKHAHAVIALPAEGLDGMTVEDKLAALEFADVKLLEQEMEGDEDGGD
jgi:hypothetical protein